MAAAVSEFDVTLISGVALRFGIRRVSGSGLFPVLG